MRDASWVNLVGHTNETSGQNISIQKKVSSSEAFRLFRVVKLDPSSPSEFTVTQFHLFGKLHASIPIEIKERLFLPNVDKQGTVQMLNALDGSHVDLYCSSIQEHKKKSDFLSPEEVNIGTENKPFSWVGIKFRGTTFFPFFFEFAQ